MIVSLPEQRPGPTGPGPLYEQGCPQEPPGTASGRVLAPTLYDHIGEDSDPPEGRFWGSETAGLFNSADRVTVDRLVATPHHMRYTCGMTTHSSINPFLSLSQPRDILRMHPCQVKVSEDEDLEQAFNRHRKEGISDILRYNESWYDSAWTAARDLTCGDTLTIGQVLSLYRVCKENEIDDDYYDAIDTLLEVEEWTDVERAASRKNDRRRAGRLGMLSRLCPVPPVQDDQNR